MPKKWRTKKQADKHSHLEKVERTSAKLDHIIVSSGGNAPKRSHPPKRLLLGAGAIVLVLAVGGFFVWRETRPDPKPKTAVTEEGVVLKKLDGEKLQKEIDKLVFQKKFSSAAQLINFQDNASTKEAKMELAMVYLNQEKHQEALQVFLDIEKQHGEHWQIAKSIGQQYQQIGDKQKALTYYKKALKLVEGSDDVPLRSDEIHFLQTYIQTLEGGV